MLGFEPCKVSYVTTLSSLASTTLLSMTLLEFNVDVHGTSVRNTVNQSCGPLHMHALDDRVQKRLEASMRTPSAWQLVTFDKLRLRCCIRPIQLADTTPRTAIRLQRSYAILPLLPRGALGAWQQMSGCSCTI
jgi:hypothetical protein